MASVFKTSVVIRKQDDGQPIYQKQDGQRFDQATTVKLNVNTKYDVRVTFRPAQKLSRLLMQGEAHEFEMEKRKDNFDDDSCTYMIVYNTSLYNVNKKTKRMELPITFEFENGVFMKTSLQCKFYPEKETEHSRWGQTLTTIDMDCKLDQGQTVVCIEKQKFL